MANSAKPAPDIVRATQLYESWLASHVRIIKADLTEKHHRMADDAFSLLRATFYRWAGLFPLLCPELLDAPTVLGVGDLHVENYGTWRDAEGRLVWGINDFDEACPLPYTNDLVRLATSACLAIRLDHLASSSGDVCHAVLDGYIEGLSSGGRPFVLSEHNGWLRDAVTSRLRNPEAYWKKLSALRPAGNVPATVQSLLRQALPELQLKFLVKHRQAGLGSLGRPRFTAIAEWRGAKIAREAKALIPSAWLWAARPDTHAKIYYNKIEESAVRAHDPFLQTNKHWVVRRLSPYCSRIELGHVPRGRDEMKLLAAMGFELANVHLGTALAKKRVRTDMARRKSKWLRHAVAVMTEAILEDWNEWRKRK